LPLRVGLPYQPYNFLVKALDDRIIAQNAEGRVQFSGTDATAVIQSALDALTSGRTWKEVVALKGVFEFKDTVNIPDYTVLDMRGAYIKAANNLNKHLFLCSRATHTDVHVDIIGGEIYGNRDNQGTDIDMDALRFYRSHQVNILGLNGHNWVAQGPTGYTPSIIKMIESWNYNIVRGFFRDNPYCSIFLSASHIGSIIGTRHYKNHRSIYLASSHFCSVIDNKIEGFNSTVTTEEGIRLYVEASYNVLIGNVLRKIIGNTSRGINITHVNCKYNRIWSNTFYSVKNPIIVPDGVDCDIRGNPGYNPVGYISPDPTWGASPWTFVNDKSVPMDVYMSVATAGDVSSITKEGQNLPIPGTSPTFICHLEPGESIVITYTTAGTLKRYGW